MLPFSSLPSNLRKRILQWSDVQESLQLLQVNKELRRHFLSSGPFSNKLSKIVYSLNFLYGNETLELDSPTSSVDLCSKEESFTVKLKSSYDDEQEIHCLSFDGSERLIPIFTKTIKSCKEIFIQFIGNEQPEDSLNIKERMFPSLVYFDNHQQTNVLVPRFQSRDEPEDMDENEEKKESKWGKRFHRFLGKFKSKD